MSICELKTVREVWNNKTGVCFEIDSDAEGSGLIEVTRRDNQFKTERTVFLHPEEAKLIAEALLDCSTKLLNKEDENK